MFQQNHLNKGVNTTKVWKFENSINNKMIRKRENDDVQSIFITRKYEHEP